MSPEVFALVGVVVGAILGGAAQVLNDWLRYRRERRERLRASRESAYLDLLGFCDQLVAALSDAAAMEQVVRTFPTEEHAQAKVGAVDAIFGMFRLLIALQQRVDVYGTKKPRETGREVGRLLREATQHISDHDAFGGGLFEVADRISTAKQRLLDDVRAEVGAKD